MTKIDITQYNDTLDAFAGNEQRATVFLDRYSRKDSQGGPVERTPNEMWGRVAVEMANAQSDGVPIAAEYNDFFGILKDFKFVPGGRILAGAGIDAEVTYYNCYVIPVETKARRHNRAIAEKYPAMHNVGLDKIDLQADSGSDSREAIFDTVGLMVDIMSRGGGVGINWSVLRPKGTHLKRVNGTTSGPVSWMDVASRAVGVVEQGGSRRGAAMFMLDDWHPDVLEFIDAKRDFSLITNANVSVAVSDEFMEQVRTGGDWTFKFPDTGHARYNSEWDGDIVGWQNRGGGVVEYATLPARDVWRKLCEAAWASGEPGLVFLGRYNAVSTGAGVERIISVNPCGEQGLGAYSVCNLGAMNLAAYVRDNDFEWREFEHDVRIATRFLDRVIDKTHYFIPENEAIQKKLRRIGLGVMGLADALIALGMKYGDHEASTFVSDVFMTMKNEAIAESAELARQYGPAPAWDKSMLSRPYLEDLPPDVHAKVRKTGLRNIFLLTQAPTGTTSILAGVNSGIEPYFAFEYTRKDRTGTHRIKPPIVENYLVDHAASDLPDYFVTTSDVDIQGHISMQASAQDWIDSSVSKTINGPNSHTVEDVESAYMMAYEMGCKGIAYFRDGSGRDQVLYRDEPKAEAPATDLEAEILRLTTQMAEIMDFMVEPERGEGLSGVTIKTQTTAGTAYVTVNYREDRPYEIFVNVGKAGSDIMELGEAIGRLGSLALRKGATLGGVANQLEGIGGNGKFNKPLAHAIGVALTKVNQPKETSETVNTTVVPPSPFMNYAPAEAQKTGDLCPECQNFSVALEEGCKVCHLCGWSAC